jgi:hypothetical protein
MLSGGGGESSSSLQGPGSNCSLNPMIGKLCKLCTKSAAAQGLWMLSLDVVIPQKEAFPYSMLGRFF